VSKKSVKDVRALLQNATRGERVVELCLRGDVQVEIERLEKRLIELRNENLETLAGNPEAEGVARQINALIDDAKDATIEVRLRALPRRQWSDLVAKHPAKSDDHLFDVSIYNDAIPACWVEPDLDAETVDKLLDELTQGQWDQLVNVVAVLNRGDQSVPFSALASQALRNSDVTSSLPDPSE